MAGGEGTRASTEAAARLAAGRRRGRRRRVGQWGGGGGGGAGVQRGGDGRAAAGRAGAALNRVITSCARVGGGVARASEASLVRLLQFNKFGRAYGGRLPGGMAPWSRRLDGLRTLVHRLFSKGIDFVLETGSGVLFPVFFYLDCVVVHCFETR